MYIKLMGNSSTFLFLLVVVMLLGVGCKTEPIPAVMPEAKQIIQPLDSAMLEKQARFVEDMKGLIKTVEASHPAFVVDDLPANYEKEKSIILEEVKKTTDQTDFRFLVRRYLTLLRDSNTQVQYPESQWAIDIECTYVDGVLLALDEVGGMTQKNITHIGSVPIQTIMNMCDLYFPAENDAARARNYSQNALNAQILQYAGCKIDSDTVEITFETQGTITTENVSFILKDPSKIYNYTTEMSSELFGDVLYIDVNAFNDNKFLDEQFEILKSAVKNGIKKVIIDVRNNPGGILYNFDKILVAMDMLDPCCGGTVRYSELAKANHLEDEINGFSNYDPYMWVAQQNKAINLVVLTNVNTFDKATMLATGVQDGKLGIIIGTPSANAPTHYGDILSYSLPNNKINVTISHVRYTRADINANQTTLVPDLVTGFDVDSLKVALDYLGKKK